MAVNEIELQEQLKEAGNRLLHPPPSTDDLLNLLDNLECLLINVGQKPSRSMQDALLLPMKALISDALLRSSDADIKVSVASCMNEITRITAPDAPYCDDLMKEIFELTVAALEKLSHVSDRCYSKAVSILDTLGKVRSCLVMLDLELDELIVKMFNLFLKTIRSNHPRPVFMGMQTIMTLIIDESDQISVELLTSLLDSIRKENKGVSPGAWKLGEKVITDCSAKLQSCLKEAVQSKSIALDEYASVVASICLDESLTLEHDHINDSGDHLMKGLSPAAASPGEVFQSVGGTPKLTSSSANALTKSSNSIKNSSLKVLEPCHFTQNTESAGAQGNAEYEVKSEKELESAPRKRVWKPNSLMNPEEGYDHSWISAGRKIPKLPRERKRRDNRVHLSSEDPTTKNASLLAAHEVEITGMTPEIGGVSGASSLLPSQSLPGSSQPKRGSSKKITGSMKRDGDSHSLRLSKGQGLDSAKKEKVRTEDSANFEMLNEGRSNSEVKQQKRPRKIGNFTKTAEGTSLPFAYMPSDDKTGSLSEPEERPLHQSSKSGVREINKNSSSSVQKNNGSKGSVSVIQDVDVAEASIAKKTKSSDRERISEEKIHKANLKRKRTPRKEVTPETPDLGQELIGSKIEVWWPMDEMYYDGVVVSYDPERRKHKVLYSDGDQETLNLRREKWKLIAVADEILSAEDQVTDIPKADSSSDKQQGHGKVKSDSAKILKVDSKRQQGHGKVKSDSAKILKVDSKRSVSKRKAKTSTRKFEGGARLDKLSLPGKAIKEKNGTDGDIQVDGQESTRKLKISDQRAEPETLEMSSSSDGTPEGDNVFCVAAIPESGRNRCESEERSSESTDTN